VRRSDCDPIETDTDSDTEKDGDGLTHFGSDPRSPDTDGDGLCDFANATCTQDNDNSAFSRAPPKIENITISVNSSATGVYYVQVKVSVSDPSKIYMVVVTFVGLSPRIVPDPFDVGWDEGSPEMLQETSQDHSEAQEDEDSVLFDLQPEAASVDLTKFKYGFGQPWNLYWTETVSRFSNYTAVFTLTDRGKLTDGFHILVEAMDQQGNINAVEKTGAIEKNFWEKSADTLKEWFNLAEGAARMYLSWMVEAIGPLIGLTFGFLYAVAKNIVDMITGLPQLIDMLVHHMNEMVDAFGAMLKNIAQVFVAMFDGMILEAEEVLPTSRKSQPAVNASTLLDMLVRFFENPWNFTATTRALYDMAYVAGKIAGEIYMNLMSGGAAIMGAIKSFLGIAKLMKLAKSAITLTKIGPLTTGIHGLAEASGGALFGIGAIAAKALGKMGKKFSPDAKALFKSLGPRRIHIDFAKVANVVGPERWDDILTKASRALRGGHLDDLNAHRLRAKLLEIEETAHKTGDPEKVRGLVAEVDAVGQVDASLPYNAKLILAPRGAPRPDLKVEMPDGSVRSIEIKSHGVSTASQTMTDEGADALKKLYNAPGSHHVLIRIEPGMNEGVVKQAYLAAKYFPPGSTSPAEFTPDQIDFID